MTSTALDSVISKAEQAATDTGWADREAGTYNPSGGIAYRAAYLDGWFAAHRCIVRRLGRFQTEPVSKTIADYLPPELDHA